VRFLLYNPNSNVALTGELGRTLQSFLQSGDSLDTATPTEGPPFIGSDETICRARSSMAEVLPPRTARTDAVILGCFGDLGVDDLRRQTGRPIVSLWDACWAETALSGQRFAILTTSPFWVERLRADINGHGLAGSFPMVRAIEAPPSAGRAQLLRICRPSIDELAQRGDVDGVVLGGALLAVLVEELQRDTQIYLYDTLRAATRIARALAVAPPHAASGRSPA